MVCNEIKKFMVFAITNNLKVIVLAFLFESIKQFLVRKIIPLFFFSASVALDDPYKIN